jgi:hypothetical protein
MKSMSLWLTLLLAAGVALAARASEADELKADLVGQCMGGRERCWKFQSTDQIKDLAVKEKSEDSQKRVYTVALTLQASKGSGKYSADARIEYIKTAGGWKIKQVGLLSIRKID